METWGTGNFDSDYALAHLEEVVAELIERIDRSSRDPSAMEANVPASVRMICDVEMLTCLAEGLEDGGVVWLPAREEMMRWKTAFLAAFDRSVDLVPKVDERWCRDRRSAVVQTFNRLLTHAATARSGRPAATG